MERRLQSAEEISGGENTVSVIIVAAGRGARMGGVNKPFIGIGGVPVLARAVTAFEESAYVREIVIVTSEDCLDKVTALAGNYGFHKISCVVTGGSTRQVSAKNGLDAVSGRCGFVAIHDGARPFIRTNEIDAVIRAAFSFGASAAAARVKDTIKVADEHGFIESTPERRRLWAVQTPQIFTARAYRRALDAAFAAGRDYTDDCQLLESLGIKVKLVECGYTNIKITTKDDIVMGEKILESLTDSMAPPYPGGLFSAEK